MITHPHSPNVQTQISSNGITWSLSDDFKLDTNAVSIGSLMPDSPATYIFCDIDGSSVQALYVGATLNLFGRLNVDLSWHPNLPLLLSMGAHFVSFRTSASLAESLSLKDRLIKSLNPPVGDDLVWPPRYASG